MSHGGVKRSMLAGLKESIKFTHSNHSLPQTVNNKPWVIVPTLMFK